MKIKIYLMCFMLFAVSNVWAVDSVRIDDVVVTASRIEENLEETTSAVTVIRGDDIRKKDIIFIPDLLRELPELNLVQNGGAGKNATVFLRGGGPEHLLVLIDGVKVNSTTTGSFDFSGINVDDIERIEIVKGPQSTIYGSEAMAGVINIITKKGKGRPNVDLSLEGGSYGTYKPSITLSGGEDKLDYRLTVAHYYTDGISAAKEGMEKDSYKNSSLSGKFSYNPSSKIRIELSGRYAYYGTDLDGFDFMGKKAVDDLNFIESGNHYTLSGKVTTLPTYKWKQVLMISRVGDSLRFRDPDDPYNNADIITSRDTIDWQHNLYLRDDYSITAGIEYRQEKGENKDNFKESISNKAVYLNNKLKLFNGDLILNAGVRYDDHERAGSRMTYKIGGIYNLKDHGVRIRSSYGTGFRAPALNELFFPFYGNSDLKPEKTNAWEVGIEKELMKDHMILSVTYFDQSYNDLIQTDPDTWTASNIAKAKVKGIETGVKVKLSESFNLYAGYTYIDSKDKETGEELTRRPRNKFNISLDYFLKDFSLMANFVFVGKSFDSSIGKDLPSYSVSNLALNYKLSKVVTIFTRVENLFDSDYEESGTYSTPGFSVHGGLKINI